MRSALLGFVTLSLSAIAIAATACADAPPIEDIDEVTREEEANEPEEEKTVIPPPPPPAETPKDAGPEEEEKKDPPPPPPPPPTNEECDPSDMTYDLKYLMSGGNLEPCPCSANECCYMVLGMEAGCLEK